MKSSPIDTQACTSASQVLIEYKQVKEKYKKTTVCYYHWRQRCYFTKERCKFAHGVRDLKRHSREDFLSIRRSFFRLKGLLHGKDNPHGIDPNPKESKVDDLAFSSDEEDSKIFRQKRKSRSKAEHDKLKVWQHHYLAEFAQFLLEESQLPYMRKSEMENHFKDVKLKFDCRLLTDSMKILYGKSIILPPSLVARSQILLPYPTLESLIPTLAQYIGKIAGSLIKKFKFPIHYKEFEKTYHVQLPVTIPEIGRLQELLNVENETAFVKALHENAQIMQVVEMEVGGENLKQGFVTAEDCTPSEKEGLIEKMKDVGIAEWEYVEKVCNETCAGTLQYFVAKDRPMRNIMWNVGFKYIQTGAGGYVIRFSGECKEFKVAVGNISGACPYRRVFENSAKSTDVEERIVKNVEDEVKRGNAVSEEKLEDELIDGKVLWVHDFRTFRYALALAKGVTQIAVDIEGCLSEGLMDMVQIAAKNHILLLDFFAIKSQPYLLSQISAWVGLLMNDPGICKTFFDCRKDSEALHKAIKCCTQNVYDIQAMHMLLTQWKETTPVKHLGTIMSPGLNVSLEAYKASHGVNEAKNTMKQIFAERRGTFEVRPLSLMFVRYAAKDVEDLIEVKDKMLKEIIDIFGNAEIGQRVAKTLSNAYVEQGCKAGLQAMLEQIKRLSDETGKESSRGDLDGVL